MMRKSKSKFIKEYGWLMALSGLTLFALLLLNQILQNVAQFAQTYTFLLAASAIGIAILVVMLVRTLLRLMKRRKAKTPGSILTARLSVLVSLIISVPLLITYYFSASFVNQGIDQWFDVKTETALNNARKLVQITLNDLIRNRLKATQQAAKSYQVDLAVTPVLSLNRLRKQYNMREASLYTFDGRLVAHSSQTASIELPKVPEGALFQQVRQNRTYAAIETQNSFDTTYQVIRVMVPVVDLPTNRYLALQAVYSLPDELSTLAESVRTASGQYIERSYLKTPLKTSFMVILTLVLLLTLISAILFTVQILQNITKPIEVLAKGTEAVSKGDYSITMPVERGDEMGQLISSFNDMTQQIAKARNDIKFGHQQTEIQKLYLQTIIKNLSSGVLTIDMNLRLRTVNEATNAILNLNFFQELGKPLEEVLDKEEHTHLKAFFDEILPLFSQDAKPWNQQIVYECPQGRKILVVHGSTLPSLDKKAGGYVIVIEDVTDLVQAQLHAAWSDVAKRLAHEIKNPLTPIQLSAERLNYRLASKLTADDAELLERMTETIIDQVHSMHELVKAFTEYADTPELSLRPTEINQLMEDIVGMYQDPTAHWQVSVHPDLTCGKIHVDASRLRQLLHNLIKNAIEACDDIEQAEIRVRSQCYDEHIELIVEDNGPGITEQSKNWIFEPYATGKPKGTGLGLAIVKKIVDEHQGQIQVESEKGQGSRFIISLPIFNP